MDYNILLVVVAVILLVCCVGPMLMMRRRRGDKAQLPDARRPNSARHIDKR